MFLFPAVTRTQSPLNEMDIEELSEEAAIYERPPSMEDAMLLVYTTIPALDFDFNWGILSIKKLREGLWQIILSPGVNIIDFSAPNYMPTQRTYSVPKGAVRIIRVFPKKNPMLLKADKWGKQKWAGVLGTISSGIAAAYFKITADNAYNSYLNADSQSKAIQNWDRVVRNDDRSKIALGVSGSIMVYTVFCYIQQRHYITGSRTSSYSFSIKKNEIQFSYTVLLR